MNYRNWLRQMLRYVDRLDTHPSPVESHFDDLATVVAEAGRRAAQAGNSEAARACEIRPGPIATTVARRVLAACLSACPDSAELTPPQVAARYNVSPDTVRLWITTGKLVARNVGTPGKRPSYRISEEALATFDRSGRVAEPPVRRRRKLSPIPFKRF